MTRIGIITIQKCDNFGADLQAYALGVKLRMMGYDAENIDYLFYKHSRHLKSGGMENPVLPISLVNKIKERLFPILNAIRGIRNAAIAHERQRRFDAWFERNVKVGREYRSVKSLYDNPPRYDVYMVGSDQVWNPRMYSNIKPYFLDFAPKGAKCVSYASSFGVSELAGGVFYRYKQWLKRFSHIGLREKTGEEIVKAMALGVEVKHVVDPTLLLTAEDWTCVANLDVEVPTGGYVLLYDLIASEETVFLARKLAKKRGWKVVRIGDGAYGPGEFLGLFAKASAVVTNSFHGTVFSILNRKPFYTIIPRTMTNASRIESLLDSVGLRSRMLRYDEAGNAMDFAPIDWAEVGARLDALRKESVDFMTRSIEEPPRKIEHKLPLGCYAVWNKDEVARANSTSGGLFRVLAERTIGRGGVVFGAAFSADFHRVAHQAAETIEALDTLMKSKYVWSDPTLAYRQTLAFLQDGREVLFAGTPCQIAAIKNLAKGKDEKLVTVDIVCHGTPRSEIFEAYAEELERRYGGRILDYEFRNKDAGWNFPRVNCEFSNGEGYNVILRNDPYYLGFGLNASLRPSCFACPFVGLERVADFTIADCWRVATSHPEWDDNRGTSLVLVNTPKAVGIWDEILNGGKIAGGPYDLDLAQMRNMPLQQRARKPKQYEEFNRVFDEAHSFEKAARCFLSRKLLFRASLTYWVKKIGWFYFRRHQ